MLLVILLCLAVGGCGRFYHLVGTIVAANDFDGAAIVEISSDEACEGRRIPAATIRLVYELDTNQQPVPDTSWQRSIVADQVGEFEIKDYGPPGGAKQVGLEINAEGYETAYTVYRDHPKRHPHVFCVSLVPVRGDEDV